LERLWDAPDGHWHLAHAPGSSFVWGVHSVKETKQNTEKQTKNKRKRKKTNEERKRKEKEKEKNNESEKNQVQSKQEGNSDVVTGRRTRYQPDSTVGTLPTRAIRLTPDLD